MSEEKQLHQELTIEQPNDHDEVYSNLAIVGHMREEFIFDFIRVFPGSGNTGFPW